MARISGVDLPRNKKIEYALTYIHGIGPSVSSDILDKVGIDKNIRVNELNDEQIINKSSYFFNIRNHPFFYFDYRNSMGLFE